MNPLIRQLLRVYDQAYQAPSWHGTPLRGSIRGLTPRAALRRPGRHRHNVWEEVLHTAYWKYIVRRRLTRDESSTFPLEGSNWFAVTKGGAREWKSAVRLLDLEHRLLRRVIARFPASRLGRRGWRSKWTNEQHIYGIASHDLYHAGQIQLVKQLIGA
jgi:DinB family protein